MNGDTPRRLDWRSFNGKLVVIHPEATPVVVEFDPRSRKIIARPVVPADVPVDCFVNWNGREGGT